MRKKRNVAAVVPVDMLEVYRDTGFFSIKFLVDRGISAKCQDCSVSLCDPDGRQMKYEMHRWGTKLHVYFKVDKEIPDGMVALNVRLKDQSNSYEEKFSFWILK